MIDGVGSIQCRLVYRSVATEEVISNEGLHDLAETSDGNNRKSGITGLLIYTGREFLGVLEGPERAVNALFQKVCRDRRHKLIRLIVFELAGQTYFEDWDMRLIDLFDLPGERRKLFLDKYPHEDGMVRIPDRLHEVYSLLLDAKTMGRREI